MRTSGLVCALVLGAWVLHGCSGEKKSEPSVEAAKTYSCPACKDKVTWLYNSKGLPTGFKKVEHTCPSCNRTWGANLSSTNVCGECAKAQKNVPHLHGEGGVIDAPPPELTGAAGG